MISDVLDFDCIFFLFLLLLDRKSIKFSLFSESEILKLAEVEVYLGLYYESTKKPIQNGLLDPRMVTLLCNIVHCDRRLYYYIICGSIYGGIVVVLDSFWGCREQNAV